MPIFPASAAYGRRISKQKFYANLSITPALRRIFTEQIESIAWSHKLSPNTLNVGKGELVEELEVFHIRLKQRGLDNAILELIDLAIPYHILFLLEFDGYFQARIGYKEPSSGKVAFKVDAYYQTEWVPQDMLPLSLAGLTLDAVYENFVRQIAGKKLTSGVYDGTSLKGAINQDKQRQKLLKQIAALENKIGREKQFNKQVELNTQLKQLRSLWKELE